MTKRPSMDLDSIIAGAGTDTAKPMQEAQQRTATKTKTKTENLEAMAFKVDPKFRKRFKACALKHEIKLNELLFASLDAFEREQKAK